MSVPFLNITATYNSDKKAIDQAVLDVLAGGHYVLGPNVQSFEKEFSEYHQGYSSLGLASGTDALLLALRASGLKPGDEVIVPAFTFISTVSTVVYAGFKPVFADIDPVSFNVTAKTISKALTKKTKAVIVVHLYGQPVDMDPVLKLCKDKKLFLIEDVAQALGAEYHGKKTGTIGKIGCFSFYPTKNLGAAGDGGMVITSSKPVFKTLFQLRDHGQAKKYHFEILGYNSRLDEIQAAILRIKFRRIEETLKERGILGNLYWEHLGDLTAVQLPIEQPKTRHSFNLYTIRTSKRDALQAYLREQGIGTAVHYPRPLHLQKAFANLGYKKGDCPEAEKAAKEVLCLPLYPGMPHDHIPQVAEAVRKFFTL